MADKGVIVEFDFAAMNGAELLHSTMKQFLDELDGIPFDDVIEARYFADNDYLGIFEAYFPAVKTKKTALKSARDFDELFRAKLGEAVPKSIRPGFVNFVKALNERGAKVLIATRADIELVRPAFEAQFGAGVELHSEQSVGYGSMKWDAWRLACIAARVRSVNALAVTGSGFGVKATLRGGLRSMAVVNPRTAYQDFSGCDALVRSLDSAAAKKAAEILRLG